LYIGRRNVEGGGRQQDFHNNSFRAVVGTRGEIADGWNYDASAQFSRVTATQKTLNYFVIDRIAKALDVVAGPGGAPTCRSVINGTDPNCVPYNVFKIGGVTQAALNYLQAPGLQQGTIDQEIWNIAFTGDLGKYGVQLPTASSGLQVAFGAEYRRDSLSNETDSLLATAGLSGTGGATIGITGATQVKDLFMEANLPLVEDKTFAKSLGLETAFRFSDYGDNSTNTYKIGLTWSPIDAVRLRGSYQRAIRAANIVELFTAQGFNLFDLTGDPCGAAAPNANATLAKCVATGVPAANYRSVALDSPAGQYNFTQGGNPNLKPEISTTKTFGIVLTPDFAPGMSLALDYFDIKIDGTISTFGAENTLNACYNNNDAASCSRITRNPANGTLWVGSGNVQDLNVNIGSLQTSGVDLNFNYNRVNIGSFGSLNFNVTATYLDKLLTEPGPGISNYDCVGFFGSVCGTPKPQMRGQSRVGWKTPWKDLDVDLTWRYIGGVDMKGGAATRIDRVFSAENYIDLAASIPVFGKSEIRFGVNNVFDNDPQLNASVGTTGNGNTYPQTYDALGRFIFVGVKTKF
jgi:outer membrane receptor protein involved in Fe transport